MEVGFQKSRVFFEGGGFPLALQDELGGKLGYIEGFPKLGVPYSGYP